MSTINIASSTNNVNRMDMSKSTAMLRYSDRNPTTDAFVGVAQFVSRLLGLGRTATATSPFTIG